MTTNTTMLALAILVVAATSAVLTLVISQPVSADGGGEPCDESAGPTGNPHTCDTPSGDPHEDNGNPDTGNPHNR